MTPRSERRAGRRFARDVSTREFAVGLPPCPPGVSASGPPGTSRARCYAEYEVPKRSRRCRRWARSAAGHADTRRSDAARRRSGADGHRCLILQEGNVANTLSSLHPRSRAVPRPRPDRTRSRRRRAAAAVPAGRPAVARPRRHRHAGSATSGTATGTSTTTTTTTDPNANANFPVDLDRRRRGDPRRRRRPRRDVEQPLELDQHHRPARLAHNRNHRHPRRRVGTVTVRLYPYVLEPKLTPAIWGGDALVRRYGKPGDAGAEARRVVGVLGREPHRQRRARRRRRSASCAPDWATRSPGRSTPPRIFPVLTKIIDARDALSVQVHPDDAYAQRVEAPAQRQDRVLVRPRLRSRCGARARLERATRRVRSTSAASPTARSARSCAAFRCIPATRSILPAGTLHAIGAGIQLFETQQASDLTYRIFDWNRMGADGKPRELHVQKAGDVLDYRATFPGAVDAAVLRRRRPRAHAADRRPRGSWSSASP